MISTDSSLSSSLIFALSSAIVLAYTKIGRFAVAAREIRVDSRKNTDNLVPKFALKDGITFYYFIRSPCARRVWLALLEKNIECNMVMVNVMLGEQRHPSYLAINPQGKVPAIRVHNHPTVDNCILYESQAIMEWLDEQFSTTRPLYPDPKVDLLRYCQVKMWQYWELSLAEVVWPLSRQQVDGVLWRILYSRAEFDRNGPPKQSSNLYYKKKVYSIYNGTYLSERQVRASVKIIIQAFNMLENELKLLPEDTFLLSNGFISAADISIYPRLCKMPQNGIVGDAHDREYFPLTMKYFNRLRSLPIFKQFQHEDMSIWDSGTFPKFAPQWWMRWLPWSVVIYIGNLRSCVNSFKRITQKSLAENEIQDITSSSVTVIPRDVNLSSFNQEHQSSVLFIDASNPLSSAVEMCLNLIGFKFSTVQIDTFHLENRSKFYSSIMPLGDVPSLVFHGRVIYGPQIIVEFVSHLREMVISKDFTGLMGLKPNDINDCFDTSESQTINLIPKSALERAHARKWFGWCHTAWHYQLQTVQHEMVILPILHINIDGDRVSEGAVRQSLHIDDPDIIASYLTYPQLQMDDIEAIISEIILRLETINAELGSEPFLCGDSMASADLFVLSTCLLGIHYAKLQDHEYGSHIHSWISRMLSNDKIRSVWSKMIAANRVVANHSSF